MNNIKNKTKKVSLFLILSVLSIFSYSQGHNTTMELLLGKNWEMQGMTDKSYCQKYSKVKMKSYLNDKIFANSDYYLSDTIEENFVEDKIGKKVNGKYIVSRVNKADYFSVYEIIDINETTMELRNIEHSHTLIYKAKEKSMN